jgi:hypothetical protein
MPYTLAEAAVACGLDKSTVRRAVRAGKISGTKDDLGVWHVEPVELHRVFPPAPRTEDDTTAVPLHAPSDAATDILVTELRALIADLRQDRDHWRTAFENQQRLLPSPHQGAPVPAAHAPSTGMAKAHSAPPVERQGWWRWLRATG